MISANVAKENLFPNITTKEDYVCWLKIIKKLGFLQCDEKVVSIYRKRDDSLSAKFSIKFINAFKVNFKIIDLNTKEGKNLWIQY